MTKAQIAGLEDSFNWFSYIDVLHKDEREKKEVSVCWMARLQISVKILGYEFIQKGMRERKGIKYPEYELVEINK